MELDTKSISILNKPRKTVTSPRLLTINHERQKPLFCPKTLARQALEPQVFRPESLPELNLIEILWRFIKYQWLEIDAYSSWQSLVSSVERIIKEFGDNYVINFA